MKIYFKTRLTRQIIVAFAIAMAFLLFVPSSTSLALSQDQLNAFNLGIYYFDTEEDNTTCGSSSVSLSGSDNEQQIFNYMVASGYTPAQAAGVTGNIQSESAGTFNPQIYQGDGKLHSYPPGDLGWGIVQWTPPSKITNYAGSVNKPPDSLGVQLQFLVAQLNGSSPNNSEKAAGEALKATTTVQDAAVSFLVNYERAADHSPSGKNATVRTANAEAAFALYGGAASASGSTPAIGVGGCGASSGGATAQVMTGEAGAPNGASELNQAQLTAVFGNPGTASNHSAMNANLTTVDFLGHSVNVNKKVAPYLTAVAQEISSMNVNYKITDMGCYRFDSDNGSSNIGLKSYHDYGAACDINPAANPFVGNGAPTPHDMPQQYIKAFHDHGFTWGGDWHSVKDYMHFEFNGFPRPK